MLEKLWGFRLAGLVTEQPVPSTLPLVEGRTVVSKPECHPGPSKGKCMPARKWLVPEAGELCIVRCEIFIALQWQPVINDIIFNVYQDVSNHL